MNVFHSDAACLRQQAQAERLAGNHREASAIDRLAEDYALLARHEDAMEALEKRGRMPVAFLSGLPDHSFGFSFPAVIPIPSTFREAMKVEEARRRSMAQQSDRAERNTFAAALKAERERLIANTTRMARAAQSSLDAASPTPETEKQGAPRRSTAAGVGSANSAKSATSSPAAGNSEPKLADFSGFVLDDHGPMPNATSSFGDGRVGLVSVDVTDAPSDGDRVRMGDTLIFAPVSLSKETTPVPALVMITDATEPYLFGLAHLTDDGTTLVLVSLLDESKCPQVWDIEDVSQAWELIELRRNDVRLI